ncbi:hypothetical protein GGF43_002590, partial [Coemansia sp. RSA 2618]
MRRREPTPFHSALTLIASEWLGNDTSGMDGLQVAIMGYKNAYANWRLGNGPQTEHMAGMSADQMKEHVAVREVILGALIDAITPEQLDTHFFGRQQNTTLHLAAFYNDANLVERILRQGAAVDISNRMGFVPSGITNDKPTLQWLAMYRGQVRGSRYQPSAMPPQHYTPESDSALDQFGDTGMELNGMHGSPMSVPHAAEAELELESLEHFSDEDVSESSYIKQFADSARSLQPASDKDVDHDSASDEYEQSDSEQLDNVSVVSSNDRCSLGLGGSSSGSVGLAKRSLEGPNLRKRALESNKRLDAGDSRPASRGSNVSFSSESAQMSPTSQSYTPSVTSYHTANGTFSDGAISPVTAGTKETPVTDLGPSPDASIRIKVDPNSILDNEIDDIFSDEDEDGVVQHEPSYCNSGAGLSDSENSRSPAKPQHLQMSLVSSGSSSASINMQSLSKAMAQAAIAAKTVPKSTAISAFPVMIHEPMQRVVDDSGKPTSTVSQLKQESTGKGAQPRAASPFMLRDSLYEMIMGRSNSRLSMASMASINSANSNALSNTSTVGAGKEPHQQDAGVQPTSPTSPTSNISRPSPTSTSFDESTGSPSQTAISSPTDNVSFNTVAKASAHVPETVPEEESYVDAEPFPEQLPPRPTFDANDYDDSASSSDDSMRGSNQNMGFDSGSIGTASAPRPTAASLFAMKQDDPITPVDEPASPVDVEDDDADSFEIPVPDTAFKAGRIGRRLGRETVEIMHDDASESVATTAKFDFIAAKQQDIEPRSPEPEMEFGSLPSDVPLTRDKRDQFLQTLINRNTMRGASPSKRTTHSAMMLAMRSASPAPAINDAAPSAGEEDAGHHSPSRGASFRQRHVSKRSEGAIDFRSPNALGSWERNWEAEPMPRPSSSAAMREALSVSGASINGRMRANTHSNTNATSKPASPAVRKVSPSLANLKTRNLVSNSPAKSTESLDASPLGLSPTRQLKLIESRVRAMSTPVDAQPPSLKLPGVGSDVGSGSRVGASSARIGRVAALSQNFERQQQQQSGRGTPRIAIPSRASALAMASKNSGDLGAVSAPLGHARSGFKRPVTRSSSMSSSHSAGGHGQATAASGTQGQKGTAKDGPPQSSQGNDELPADDGNGAGDGGCHGGAAGGAGNSGQGGGDDDGNSSDKHSPDPRAALLDPLESNDSSSSSHNSSSSTGCGLAANIRGDSPTVLLGSTGSGDNIGSSIFSSTESRSSSGAEQLTASEPARLHAPVSSRRETESERRRRFKELANRRKSGTLEKMSNSGLVKNRQALFVPSDPVMRMPSSSSSASSSSAAKRSRVKFADTTDKDSTSFLGHRGEENRPPDSAGNDAMPSSLSSVDVDLERLHRANAPSLHPHQAASPVRPHESVPSLPTNEAESTLTRESSVRGGVDADVVLERTLARAQAEAARAAQGSPNVLSRGSSDRSKGGSGSGDDSLHILSSFDTNSTPGSTPMDSAQDNLKVGLMAQYAMNQGRADRRMRRSLRSAQPNQESQTSDSRASISQGFSAIGDANSHSDAIGDDAEQVPTVDVLVSESDSGSDSDLSDEEVPEAGFDTMMPPRPRYNPQALFRLSTVVEEDEESRNTSLVASDASRLAASQVAPVQAATVPVTEMQERRSSAGSMRGLRAALGQHMSVAPIYRGLGSVSIPDATAEDPISPLDVGVTQEVLDAASQGAGPASPRADMEYDPQLRTMSIGSQAFDPNIFDYTSEENSTMASRSSLERSDIFNMGRPGSSASRVLVGVPLDAPVSESYAHDSFTRQQAWTPGASTSRVSGRHLRDSGLSASAERPGSAYSSGSSISYVGKGKAVHRMPEMEQIQPMDSLPHAPVPTLDELDAAASSDEEPINPLLFAESQDFEGYVPIGRQIQQEQDERRQERRRKKEAARLGITLPEEEPEEVISPLWFEENNYIDPLPPNLMKFMLDKRDRLMVKKISKNRTTENPNLKRELEMSTISSRRLREELDETMCVDADTMASRGTIKQLTKRARTSDISSMFNPPAADDDADNEAEPSSSRRRSKRDKRRSYLDSVEIPVSELSSDASSEEEKEVKAVVREGWLDEDLLPVISQDFQ